MALVGLALLAGSGESVSTSASVQAQVRPATVRVKQTQLKVGAVGVRLVSPQAEVKLMSGRRSRVRFQLRVSNPTDRSVLVKHGLQRLRSVHGCLYSAAPATVRVSGHRTANVTLTFVLPTDDPATTLVLKVGKRSRSVGLQVTSPQSGSPARAPQCAAGSGSAGKDDSD